MRIFSFLTGKKDHHIVIKRDKRERPRASRFWWFIVREDLVKYIDTRLPGSSSW